MTSAPETPGPRPHAAVTAPDASARLDAHLVETGVVRSRGAARELIAAGSVRLEGRVVTKASRRVEPGQLVETDDAPAWVGRGAVKLVGALQRFATFDPRGARCLDIGASTGGFTQVLLHAGAAHVVALDVGHGQLVPELAAHEHVTDLPGMNIRAVTPEELGEPFDLVVGDLSFISLRYVLPVLPPLLAPAADIVLLIKPQFEVGRERIGKNGLVRSEAHRLQAVRDVVDDAASHALFLRDIMRSPVTGSSGNVEYLAWFSNDTSAPTPVPDRFDLIARIAEGEDE